MTLANKALTALWERGNRADLKGRAQISAEMRDLYPAEARAFARALYAEWHRCDEAGAEVIVMEAPPALPEWAGITDRLARAAA